jgi:uncharacterized membrane protein YhiD involved in acid resistance
MSHWKLSLLGIVIAIGGLSAGWGFWYGAVAAIGFVILVIGNELIEAVKEQTTWLQEDLENDLATAALFNEAAKLDLSEIPSELTAAAIFGETE